MKSFKAILSESGKTYSFKIGLAGSLPDDVDKKLEVALKKFDAQSISKGKSTPIQERPLDFPRLQNTEVTYYDIELRYPTTTQVLQEYLGQQCCIHQSYIIVRSPGEPQEAYQAEKSDDPYESILNTEEMGGESAQESVGGSRIMSLLQELEKSREENHHDPAAAAPQGNSADISSEENSKSTIGS